MSVAGHHLPIWFDEATGPTAGQGVFWNATTQRFEAANVDISALDTSGLATDAALTAGLATKQDTIPPGTWVPSAVQSWLDPVADFGAIGDGSTHPASTLIPGTYATLVALREARWSGCRFAADDGFTIFDPKDGAGTLYVRAGIEWAHITYDTTTGVITLDSSSGGIDIGAGALTGTTGTNGRITISGTSSVLYVENRSGARVAVVWSEALTTDEVDWLATQHALALAAYDAGLSGGIGEVRIPLRTYLHNRPLYVFDNTKVVNEGHHKLTGGNALGGFVFIQAAANVELTGGIWDSNEQGNDNTINIGNGGLNGTVVGPLSSDIKVHHLTIQNARHGGAHLVSQTDVAEVGHGGGKGITCQHGARRVLIDNVTIDDCDIGFSAEGLEDVDPVFGARGVSGIAFTNSTVRGSRFMGAILAGDYNTPALYGRTLGVVVDNVLFQDCASGLDNQVVPANVADNFGVITTETATHIIGRNITIRNTSGIISAVRGSFRYSDIDLSVDAPSIKDVINGRKYGGWGGTDSQSRYNQIDVTVLLNGPQANGTGWLVTHDTSFRLELSEVKVYQQYRDGASVGGWAGARIVENQATTTLFEFYTFSTGTKIVSNGQAAVLNATNCDYTINGVGFDDDAANSQQRIVPRASRALALCHADSAAGIQINAAVPSVNDTTAMLLRVQRGGVVALAAVTLGAADSGGTGFRALRVAN